MGKMVEQVYRAGRLYGFRGMGGRKVFTVKRYGVNDAIKKAERADRSARTSARNPMAIWGMTKKRRG